MVQLPLIARTEKLAALAISGDATAAGSETQLSSYLTIRDLGLQRDAHVRFQPLSRPFQRTIDIPGNHDFWDGMLLWPFMNPAVRGAYFDRAPEPFRESTGRHLIALYGLCSTSGATPWQQSLAIGAFHQPDLDWIGAQITATREEATRRSLRPFHIVMIHHSPAHGNPHFRGISTGARSELQALGVNALITGHAHTTALAIQSPPGFPREVRCATTTRKAALSVRNREFLVHTLSDLSTGALDWRVQRWVFDGSSAFVRAGQPAAIPTDLSAR
jgi:hypothetical protein